MKCQACDQPATCHVTEIVDGNPVEYHVCEEHAQQLDALKPVDYRAGFQRSPFSTFLAEPALCQALREPASQARLAAHLLPALCLGLLDVNPGVRVSAVYRLIQLGRHAQSASADLQDAIGDKYERVRRAAQVALDHLRRDPEPFWFF
jgi:hypothetical protein